MTAATAPIEHLTDQDYTETAAVSDSEATVWDDNIVGFPIEKVSNQPADEIRLDKIRTRFEELLSLRENWDSYGAPPIRRALVEQAIDFIEAMGNSVPVPSIVPTVKGGVQLEWHQGQIDLEVEIEEASTFNVIFEDLQTGEEWELDRSQSLRKIREALRLIECRSAG